MNKLFFILSACFIISVLSDCNGSAGHKQEVVVVKPVASDTSSHICLRIIKLIKEDSVAQLSTLVRYPLKRPNPVPDINTPEAFILYYPVLFDSTLKAMINDFVPAGQNLEPFQGSYELPGNIRVDEYYKKITRIEYCPKAEMQLRLRLEKEVKNTIYPKLKNYDHNFIVGQTRQYKFRVDSVGNNMRFACWHAGQLISEKPDIIITKAEPKIYYGGSDGSYWDYQFKDGDRTYWVAYGPHDGFGFEIRYKQQREYYEMFKEIK